MVGDIPSGCDSSIYNSIYTIQKNSPLLKIQRMTIKSIECGGNLNKRKNKRIRNTTMLGAILINLLQFNGWIDNKA